MKLKALCFLGFCLLACTGVLPAKDAAPTPDSAPVEAPLFQMSAEHQGMDDRVFPLGWSADGKFAWVVLHSSEGMGESRWTFTILDLDANKAVEQRKYDLGEGLSIGMRQFWAKHGKEVSALLKKHGVKRSAPAMDHLPLVLGKRRGVVFNPVLEATAAEHPDYRYAGVKSFRVFASATEKAAPIFQWEYKDYLFPFTVAIVGCYVSPDETRAALVIAGAWKGWEGAPHPRYVDVIAGCKTGIE